MASAILIARPQNYVGAAADTKPSVNVSAGSHFYEYDTDTDYIYTDAGGWTAWGNPAGTMRGSTLYVTSTPVLSAAGAYATGDYVGTTTTPQAFLNAVSVSGKRAVIKSIALTDKTTTAAIAMELWLFSATFTAPTDSAAWAISDADNLLCLGVIPISTSKWYATSNNKAYSDDTLALVIQPAATSLFYALVARGTQTTWVSGDLQISLGILDG